MPSPVPWPFLHSCLSLLKCLVSCQGKTFTWGCVLKR
jgi:hypothetical protein